MFNSLEPEYLNVLPLIYYYNTILMENSLLKVVFGSCWDVWPSGKSLSDFAVFWKIVADLLLVQEGLPALISSVSQILH